MKNKIHIIGTILTILLITSFAITQAINKSESELREIEINEANKIMENLHAENEKLRAIIETSQSKIDKLESELKTERESLSNAMALKESNSNEWHIRNNIVKVNKERVEELK